MGSVVKSVTKGIGKVAESVLGLERPQPPAGIESPPAVTAPKPMPVQNDEAVRAAQKKSVAEQRRRRGRTSTILTAASDSDTLG
jgi:hypothetical protein